jgi:hypothetical protein
VETNDSNWHPVDCRKIIQTLLYADDQVILAESEAELQIIANE